MSNRIIFNVSFIVVLLVGVVMALSDMMNTKEQSQEGHLMAEVCKDVRVNETLRAEADIEQIINVIERHVHRNELGSDQAVRKVVEELRALKDEAVFRNTYQGVYNKGFTHVLNQLSYITLMDALESLKDDNYSEALASIEEAQGYIHDALIFSKGDAGFEREMELLHQLNLIKRDPDVKILQGFAMEIYQLI